MSRDASRWRERAWKAALFVVLLAMLWLFLSPASSVPRAPPFPFADKVQHAILFAAAGAIAARAYADKPRWGVYAALVFFGACVEIAQPQVGRSGDVFDLLADAVGALVVFALPRKRAAPG